MTGGSALRRRREGWKRILAVAQGAGYVVVDLWRAKPGMGEQVDRLLMDAAPRFRAAPGVVSVDYTRLEDTSDTYLVIFRYVDRAAREAFVATDDLRDTMAALRQVWDLESPIYRGEAIV